MLEAGGGQHSLFLQRRAVDFILIIILRIYLELKCQTENVWKIDALQSSDPRFAFIYTLTKILIFQCEFENVS